MAPQVRRDRYAAAIKAAAYFVAAAGVTNVIKPVDAENTTVRRDCPDDGLTMEEVHDGGQVFAPSQTPQTVLTGLCDRRDSLSGHLERDSRPGRGTVPCATLPARTAVTSHA